MNLQESIRRILREEVNSVDMRTIQSELFNILGPSKLKNGNRVEFKSTIGSFDSSFNVIVDHLDQKTLNFINNFMSEKGWFPTNIGLDGLRQHIYSNNFQNYIGQDDVQIRYEANTGKQFIPNKSKAYHVTPDTFVNNILENGIVTKSESKLSNHPERIYLNLNKDMSKDMITTIWNSLSKERQQTIKDYYVLEIDLTQIPNHKFYHDPASIITLEAIYTDQSIPKSAVKVVGKINTKDLKIYDDDKVLTLDQEKQEREERKRKEEERIKQDKEREEKNKEYEKISQGLEELPDEIRNMSIDDLLKENIRRVLKESVAPQVRRRQEEFDKIFLTYRDSFIDHEFRIFKSFWNLLMESSLETLYHAWFSKTVSDDDWEESAEYIENYLIEKYYDDTKKMWEKKHRKKINESEDKNIEKNLRLITKLLETIDIDGLCKIWVKYNPEDGDYEIRSKTTIRYYDMADMVQELGYIEDTLRSWKLKPYIFTPNYVENCEDEIEFMNESDKSKQERKFTKLLNNIEEYLNSNSYKSVVRFMVDYDEVMDDVIVNIFFDSETARELGGGINSVIKRTGKKIMEDLTVFPFDFKYHIHFEKPQSNESRTNSSLNNLLNMLFDGFDDIYYDWANFNCGMGVCCDPYAIGFTLPKNHYDDYIFKLVDGDKYDDYGDYPKELSDELPEVCYESPDIKNPDFDTIVFYGLYGEEIEDYMGPESNWRSDLLKIINKKFGCEAKQIIII